MHNQEIVLNLWYLCDETGAVYSLRARCYLGTGTDEEKLSMLRQCAATDYLIAQSFDVPSRFHVIVVKDNGEQETYRIAHMRSLKVLGGVSVLFEDVFREMQAQLPAQTALNIGDSPLCCTTPLLVDDEYNIRPVVRK